MTLARALIFFLLSMIAACTENESVVTVDMSKVESAAPLGPASAITYAYLPQYSHSVSFERHRRLLEHLRHKTGLSLRQVFPNTWPNSPPLPNGTSRPTELSPMRKPSRTPPSPSR